MGLQSSFLPFSGAPQTGMVPSLELPLGENLQSETLLAGPYLQDIHFPFLSSNPWVAM